MSLRNKVSTESPIQRAAPRAAGTRMRVSHPHLAALIFNRPLMIHRPKLHAIIRSLAPRIGANAMDFPDYEDMPAGASTEAIQLVDGVAVIPVFGTLVKRCGGMEAESGLTSYETLGADIMDAATNPDCKAILLDVDSYGGECAGAFDLSDLIYQARQTVPIYGVANCNALSAGYALISACEKIWVTQDGNVGSIGVIAEHCDQSEFDAKLGVKYTPITYGEHKNDYSSHAPLTDAAMSELQTDVDRLGNMFVQVVARNRGMDADKVRATQAAIYPGQEGVREGLADSVGTRSDAFSALQSRLSNRRLFAPSTQTNFLTATASAVASPLKGETTMSQPTQADANRGTPAQSDPAPDQQTTTAAGITPFPQSATEAPQLKMSANELNELNTLCAIAGAPHKLSGFIQRNVSFLEAKRELVAARVEASGPELQTHAFASTMDPAAQPKTNSLIDSVRRRLESTGRKVKV